MGEMGMRIAEIEEWDGGGGERTTEDQLRHEPIIKKHPVAFEM
jgi:hypothetical protein